MTKNYSKKENNQPEVQESNYEIVHPVGVYVRSEQSLDSESVRVLKPGEQFTGIDTKHGFIKVEDGFVKKHKDLLKEV